MVRTLGSREQIETDVQSIARRFGFEFDENTPSSLHLSTRLHGDLGEERPGKQDINNAHAVGRQMEAKFTNVRYLVETCDEWTTLEIRMFPREIKRRPPAPAECDKAIQGCEAHFRSELLRLERIKSPHGIYASRNGLTVAPDSRHPSGSFNILALVHAEDAEATDWSLHLCAGRHRARLDSLNPDSIIKAWEEIGSISESFKDMSEFHIILGIRDRFIKDIHSGSTTSDPQKAYIFHGLKGKPMPGVWRGGPEDWALKLKADVFRWRFGYAPEKVAV